MNPNVLHNQQSFKQKDEEKKNAHKNIGQIDLTFFISNIFFSQFFFQLFEFISLFDNPQDEERQRE